MSTSGFPWLSLVTFLPVAGATLLAFLPRRLEAFARWWGLGVALATFGVSLGMLAAYHAGTSGFQLVDHAVWVSSLHLQYLLGVDGISLFLVLLTTFLMPIAMLASWRVSRPKLYMASFLVLESAVLGSFLALDLLLFFLFFEGLLFPMYLIVGGWGGERRVYAALKFFLFTMAGSAFLFAALLFLSFKAGSQLGHTTFDIRELAALSLPLATGRWLFLGFLVAFAVKVPLVPFHTWQPDAYTEAPAAGSLVLAALLAKVGAYGLIRFNLTLFPEASYHFRTLVIVLAVIGIVYGAAIAVMQTDIKRLIAYSSLSHLGFIVLGIFAFNVPGASGSVLYMVNHGLSTGALFLLVGMLGERIGTNDLRRMGGLASRVPVLAGVFLFMALASAGLPGLNNFVGEFLVLLGTFAAGAPWAVVAVTALVLSAIYLLWSYQQAFHGVAAITGASDEAQPSSKGNGAFGGEAVRPERDLTPLDYAVVVPLVAAVLFLGLYPKPLLSRIELATTRTIICVDNSVPAIYSRFPRFRPADVPAARRAVQAICAGTSTLGAGWATIYAPLGGG